MVKSISCGFAAAVVAVVLFSVSPGAADTPAGSWAERVQIVYDPDNGTVERVRLRAWDAEPHLNLEFLWEPDAVSQRTRPAADGAIEGSGKLVWRVRGSAAHDPRTVHKHYRGGMAEGRPHGKGRLETRAGEVFEGNWMAGLLEGEGMLLDSAGNRYQGGFVAGLPHGNGRQAMADGSIYEGGFRHGQRHGQGTLRLPGGSSYASTWRDGVETGKRPDVVADALLGGLLRAQSGGGDAGKVDVSIVVEPRMNQQASLQYTHVVLDEHIEIYPSNEGIVEAWLGQMDINDWNYGNTFGYLDWEDVPAFIQVDLATNDRSRVRTEALELQVADSQVYRKPFLSTISQFGCIGFRPSFSLQNNGWGAATQGKLTVSFHHPDDPGNATRPFTVDVADVGLGLDISLRSVLDEAGVDTAALEAGRFTCPSRDELPQCQANLANSIDFGELTGMLSGDYATTVGISGTFDYTWSDDRGNDYRASEKLSTYLQLAVIETEIMVAESGDIWGQSPEALRYQVVRLPRDQQNYVVDMPIRGNKNLSNHTARLKVYAETSSIHQLRVAARFADGSERYSKPVSLFMVKPRDHYYHAAEPAACYLDPMYTPPRGGG